MKMSSMNAPMLASTGPNLPKLMTVLPLFCLFSNVAQAVTEWW